MSIQLDKVSKAYGDVNLFKDATVSFPESGVVAIVGPSGKGKTTLLRIIANLEKPDAGIVAGVPDKVAILFEDDRLFPWMDVLANVLLAGGSKEDALAILGELGLEGREHARIGDLSSGQRRRVALARALAYDAPLLLLDEPTARLDEGTAGLVFETLEKRCKSALVIVAAHSELPLGDVVFSL